MVFSYIDFIGHRHAQRALFLHLHRIIVNNPADGKVLGPLLLVRLFALVDGVEFKRLISGQGDLVAPRGREGELTVIGPFVIVVLVHRVPEEDSVLIHAEGPFALCRADVVKQFLQDTAHALEEVHRLDVLAGQEFVDSCDGVLSVQQSKPHLFGFLSVFA